MAHDRIVCNPKIKAGRPAVDELLEQFPSLTREDVLAAQTFAADYLASDEIVEAAG